MLRDRMLIETRSVYESLVGQANPVVIDLYRYATFLIDSDEKQDLPKVEGLLHQLQSMKEGTLAALEIGVRYAGKMGEHDSAPEIVNSWAERAFENGMLEDGSVSSIAGGTLLKLGFVDAGIEWFERAYKEDPKTLTNYVVALNRVGRVEESVKVCAKHFKQNTDVLSANLLFESLLNDVSGKLITNYETVIGQTQNNFPDNASLLESIATLRMQQGQLDEAITLYEKVRNLDPLRIRTLNNLAMALSEAPGRAAEGLDPINSALKLANDNPELLDTKGVVLLKAGRFDEARDVFQQAKSKSDEPRFQFHLILTLLAQNKQAEAERAWKSLDLDKLDPAGLTANEQEKLATMKQEFGS